MPETAHCLACQALLTDALDGSLGEIDQAWFDHHVRNCSECGPLFADAQRGAAWLGLLKDAPPEPSADLVDRILTQTTEPAHALAPVPATVLPFRPRPYRWTHLPPALFEPRLAMTAAMALFSLALTMNLTGIQLGQLRPTNLRRTYYQSTAEASRYCDNLRVVRVLESRVDDLREASSDIQPTRNPSPQDHPAPSRPKQTSRPNNGVSRRDKPQFTPADRPKTLYAQAHSRNAGGLV